MKILGFDEHNPEKEVDLQAELVKAEVNLAEWATGHRSTTNMMMDAEVYVREPGAFDHDSTVLSPDRQRTLAAIATADAAELELAINKVRALRLLCGLTPEGDDPVNVERRRAAIS